LKRRFSISFQLTAWFSAVFLVGFIMFGVAMWLDLAYFTSHGRSRTLARRASRLVELMRSSVNANDGQRAYRFSEFADSTPEGNLIQILDGRGSRLLPVAPVPPDFPWPAAVRAGQDRYIEVVYDDRHYRILERPVTVGGQPYLILVGGNLEDNRQLMARFSTGLEAAIPALLAVSALAGYLLSGRVLGPIGRLTSAVRSITIGNLSHRLPIDQTGDEIARLAETCNEMLTRLEAAVGRINRFTADASHELRSPISFIRAVAEFALRDPHLDADAAEALQEIHAESAEASRLIEDMLTLARADAGHPDLVFKPVDLAELVREVCDKVRPFAELKQQEFLIAGASDALAGVLGDRSRLRRLIWTLLDNAVKYTPERGRIETILERNGEDARLSIKDSGVGIAPALLPRVFERFFRVDPARSQVDGTGLGLAIAKWIADAHHAVLSVASTEGEGSTFSVVFPLSR
jgi:heavy metal sensor kinase